METLEFIKKVEDGKIVIELPAGMEGKNLRVKIEDYIITEPKPEDWAKLPPKERLKILQRFKGAAKYPDADTNKYDVYEQ